MVFLQDRIGIGWFFTGRLFAKPGLGGTQVYRKKRAFWKKRKKKKRS
jgi:hypothetical protein